MVSTGWKYLHASLGLRMYMYIRMTCMINISLYKYSICHFDNQISQPTLAFPLWPTPTPSSTQFNPVVGHSSDKILSVYAESGFAGLLELFLLWWVVDGLFSTWRTKARTRYIDFLRPKHKQYTFAHRRIYVAPIHQLGLAPLFVE